MNSDPGNSSQANSGEDDEAGPKLASPMWLAMSKPSSTGHQQATKWFIFSVVEDILQEPASRHIA